MYFMDLKLIAPLKRLNLTVETYPVWYDLSVFCNIDKLQQFNTNCSYIDKLQQFNTYCSNIDKLQQYVILHVI